MITREELEYLDSIVQRFESSVNKLIELEAMKAENRKREENGEALAYEEKQFLDLIA